MPHEAIYEARDRSASPRAIQQGESLYEFCDRLDLPELGPARTLTRAWLSRIPEQMRPEFVARIRSKRPNDHISAIHELFLFNLFEQAGFAPTIPEQPEGGSRPEMTITVPGGNHWSVEAKVRMPSDERETQDARIQQVLHTIAQRAVSPRLRIWIHRVQSQRTAGPGRAFAHWLNCWWKEADRPEVTSPVQFDRRQFEHDSGWMIDVTLWNYHKDATGGIELGRAGDALYIDPEGALKKLLAFKRRQHRDLSTPMITAVSWNDFLTKPEDVEVAKGIFGPPAGAKELIWCSPCYPWTLSAMSAELWLLKGSEPSAFARAWPHKKCLVVPESYVVERK